MSKRDGEIALIRGPEEFSAAFAVSRQVVDRLAIYEALLRQWQKTINLVAPSTLDAVWHRHFADSAQLGGAGSGARGRGSIWGRERGSRGWWWRSCWRGACTTSVPPPTPNPSPQGGGGPTTRSASR